MAALLLTDLQEKSYPGNMVSLVPSLTELLLDLGMNRQVLGVTSQCLYPEVLIKKKTKVGDTQQPDIGIIRSLQPGLVFVSAEDTPEPVLTFLRSEFNLWESKAGTLADALGQIRRIGELLDKPASGDWLADIIASRFETLQAELKGPPVTKKTLYLKSARPWLAAGTGALVSDILKCIGLETISPHTACYAALTDKELKKVAPELILLSGKEGTVADHHTAILKRIFPDAAVFTVSGDLLEWCGSRLLRTPDYLRSLRLQLGLATAE